MEASSDGSWVILQNCHLAEKWMERLVKVWEDQLLSDESKIHPAFRLWLTCYATPNFPSQLLQSGVKVSTLGPNHFLVQKLPLQFAHFTSNLTSLRMGFSEFLNYFDYLTHSV